MVALSPGHKHLLVDCWALALLCYQHMPAVSEVIWSPVTILLYGTIFIWYSTILWHSSCTFMPPALIQLVADSWGMLITLLLAPSILHFHLTWLHYLSFLASPMCSYSWNRHSKIVCELVSASYFASIRPVSYLNMPLADGLVPTLLQSLLGDIMGTNNLVHLFLGNLQMVIHFVEFCCPCFWRYETFGLHAIVLYIKTILYV